MILISKKNCNFVAVIIKKECYARDLPLLRNRHYDV